MSVKFNNKTLQGGYWNNMSLASIYVGGNKVYESWDGTYSYIYYTSTNGKIVTPYSTKQILSNTYEDGQGCITFKGTITSIGDYAFSYCTSLTEITIPNSVTSIGNYAFKNCTSLTGITIPNSVTSIGNSAFSSCSSLSSFNGTHTGISSDNRTISINGVLKGFAPSGLTSYTIPNNVTSIGNNAFNNCISLTGIIIPNSVTTIGDYAFSVCSSLTGIIIPNSVTTIGDYAFSYCTSLTGITIPNSVTSIGMCAFFHCSSLEEVICNPTTPPTLEYGVFDGNASGRLIKVPSQSVNTYKTATNWSSYASDIISQ